MTSGPDEQVEKRRVPCADATGDDMVGTEGERGQLGGEVGGHALTDDESDHDQEHQERSVERGLGRVLVHRGARFMGWEWSRRARAAPASEQVARRGRRPSRVEQVQPAQRRGAVPSSTAWHGSK